MTSQKMKWKFRFLKPRNNQRKTWQIIHSNSRTSLPNHRISLPNHRISPPNNRNSIRNSLKSIRNSLHNSRNSLHNSRNSLHTKQVQPPQKQVQPPQQEQPPQQHAQQSQESGSQQQQQQQDQQHFQQQPTGHKLDVVLAKGLDPNQFIQQQQQGNQQQQHQHVGQQQQQQHQQQHVDPPQDSHHHHQQYQDQNQPQQTDHHHHQQHQTEPHRHQSNDVHKQTPPPSDTVTDMPAVVSQPPATEQPPVQDFTGKPTDIPDADVIDSKPELAKLQTDSEDAGSTVEGIMKTDTTDDKQKESEEQYGFDATTSQQRQSLEPVDIAFTPGDISTSSQSDLSPSMEERVMTTDSIPTPTLDIKATQVEDQTATGTEEQNLRQTVIDGTTIPLYDDMEGDFGLTTAQDQETSSESVAEVSASESQYKADLTDLPFAEEPSDFTYTQDEEPKQEQEQKEEVKDVGQEEVKEEEKTTVANPEKILVNDTQNTEEPPLHIEPTADQIYHGDDFLSRKPLSVGQGHPPQNQVQGKPEEAKPPVEPSQATEIPGSTLAYDITTPPSDFGEIPPPLSEARRLPTDEEQGGAADAQIKAPPVEDPYQTGSHNSRQFTEDHLEEETVAGEGGGLMASLESSLKAIIVKLPPSLQSLLEQEPLGLSPTLFVLVTIATMISFATIMLCGCICGGGKQVTRKDPLVVVREIEEKLFIATKEKENLEDQLQLIQSEKKHIEEQLMSQETTSGGVQTELQNVKLHNEALKTQMMRLEEQVDDLTGQVSSTKGDTQSKDKQVKDLHKQISKLEEKNKKSEEQLQKKSKELKDMAEDTDTLKGQIKSISEQVKQLETRKQQLLSEADDWKEKVEDLNERLRQNKEEFKQMQETVAFKDNEMEVLKDCFRQLKVLEGNDEDEVDQTQVEEKIQKMMDVSRVNASLRALQDEHDSVENRLQIETDGRKEVEDQLEKCRRDMETLQTDKMKADRQCLEAQTKLNVLSNYFKEKETQLQRELGEHEALKKQNVNKLENIDERARLMEEEVEMYKAQAEGLKRELASSERDFRQQISANEKKAHENWLAARAAERELKEVRHDAGVLRQKLTELERRQMMGPGGLIRPLPTRGMPPPGMMNGPPSPPGMERSPSRGSIPPPHLRDDDFRGSPHDRLPPPPDRRPPPPGARLPPHMPPDGRSPPPGRMIQEGRSPPPFDRRPPHPMDRRTPPYRPPPRT
ncbi:transport and Golgi organization protein 1 homolog [Haliotis rubra]|uniref:transport and Golgi organization protein 1 homolog n=1 Tax=Haliotis rubra TaxID=36100 RepID=UPI001EE5582F|nr:transport and Golgi organization protein 1 homolog [Haliotis rubra]